MPPSTGFHGQLLPPVVHPAVLWPSNASAQRAAEQYQQQALQKMLFRAAPKAAKSWYELQDICGARTEFQSNQSEHRSWPIPFMLTSSVHPPSTNSSPAFSFMHFNKGGGSTQKELLFELSQRNHWPNTGAGMGLLQAYPAKFWNETNAHRFRLLWGASVLGQASHTGRPVVYWTSLRDPTARTISHFNQICACGIHDGVVGSPRNSTQTGCTTVEAHTTLEAYSYLRILLGFERAELQAAVQACAAAGVRDKMMATLLELATTQLRQPCMSALRLSSIDNDVQRLNQRWARLGFRLPGSVPHANTEQRGGAGGTQICQSPRLVDAHDPAVVARVEAAGQADPVGALTRKLHKWHEAADDLWTRPLTLCAH